MTLTDRLNRLLLGGAFLAGMVLAPAALAAAAPPPGPGDLTDNTCEPTLEDCSPTPPCDADHPDCPPPPCDEDDDECPPPPCEEEGAPEDECPPPCLEDGEADECPPPPCEEGDEDCPPPCPEEGVAQAELHPADGEDECPPPPCPDGDTPQGQLEKLPEHRDEDDEDCPPPPPPCPEDQVLNEDGQCLPTDSGDPDIVGEPNFTG